MRILVPRTFVPKEAGSIASRYTKVARELREIADQMSHLMNSLEESWEGNAKQKYFGEYGAEPSNLRAVADFCDQCGSKIRSMSVTTMEWKEVENPWQD